MMKIRSLQIVALLAAFALFLAACGDDAAPVAEDEPDAPEEAEDAEAEDAEAEDAEAEDAEPDPVGDPVELAFAHSYSTAHPHHRCGAVVVAEKVADAGIQIEIFPDSTLGPDADRTTSVMTGDIDIDLQGASAMAATYGPVGTVDSAYVFEGPDHLFEYLDSDAFGELQQNVLEAMNVRILDAWFFGMRHFTADRPIREPEDFAGVRMRFPDTPQYLANAEALGADAVAVAFEEVYLSLQQGVIGGQENPIPTIEDMNFVEVQDYLSLTGHQTGFQFVIVSEQTWQQLSGEQQDALRAAFREARDEDRQCIEETEAQLLEEWQETGALEVVEDVNRAAFIERAEEHFSNTLEGETLELYESIRATAP